MSQSIEYMLVLGEKGWYIQRSVNNLHHVVKEFGDDLKAALIKIKYEKIRNM